MKTLNKTNRTTPGAIDRPERFPRWLLAALILLGCAMIIWQRIICGDIAYTGDSMSYFLAWNLLKDFHPDYVRTPIYPFILRLIYSVFDVKTANFAMQVIQWSVWIAGCRWTWLILRHMHISKTISTAVVIFLMAFPGTWIWNNCLMTECWASAFIPLLVLQLIRYRETKKTPVIILGGTLMFLLVYLKPQLMFLVVLWGIAWGVATFDDKFHFRIVLLISAFVAGSLLFYKWSMHRCYLQNNLSTVSPRNNYCSLRMAGLIHVDEIENPAAREILRKHIETDPGIDLPGHYLYWGETYMVSTNALDSICSNAYRRHAAEANRFILHRIPQTLSYSIFYSPARARPTDTQTHLSYYELEGLHPSPGVENIIPDIVFGKDLFAKKPSSLGQWIFPLYGIMDIPFWMAWVTMGAFIIWYLAIWCIKRRFPVVPFFIASITLCGYLTVFIGAPYDWGRLVTPFCMLLFAMGGIMVANVKKTLSGWWLKRRGFA